MCCRPSKRRQRPVKRCNPETSCAGGHPARADPQHLKVHDADKGGDACPALGCEVVQGLKPLEMLTRPPLPGSNFFGLGIDVRSGLAQATLFRGALLPLTATCRWRRARVYRAPPPQAPPPG